MPFGATVVGDVFQCRLDECFGKIEQVIIIADDIMIVGYKPDHSDYDRAFPTLLQTAKQCYVKLNYGKLQYKQNEVEFFGKTYTPSGHKPSKDKVAAITSTPSQTNKKQVQSFIGMINYLAMFSPRLSELAELIRKLAKDKSTIQLWSWTSGSFHTYEERDCKYSCSCLLQPQEANYPADRSQHQRSWCLSTTRFKTSLFCKQGSHRCPERLCCDWVRISCSDLGNGEVPSFSLCQSFSAWNRPETARSYIIQKS